MSRPPPSPPPPAPLHVRPAPYVLREDHWLFRLLRMLTPDTPVRSKPIHFPRVCVPQAPTFRPTPEAIAAARAAFPGFDPAAVDLAPLTPALARRIAGGHANEAAAHLRRLARAGLAGPDDHQLLAAIDRWTAGDLT